MANRTISERPAAAALTGTEVVPVVQAGQPDVNVRTTAAAIAALSSGLPAGGTVDQVLTKQSSTDGDAAWEDAAAGGSEFYSMFILTDPNPRAPTISMRTANVTLLTPADPDAIVTSSAYASGVPLVFDGVDGGVPPRRVTITELLEANHTGTMFAIVGLDENGAAANENLAGPGELATVTSVNTYSQVTSITPNATNVNTISVGLAASPGWSVTSGIAGLFTLRHPLASDLFSVQVSYRIANFDSHLDIHMTTVDDDEIQIAIVDDALAGADTLGIYVTVVPLIPF